MERARRVAWRGNLEGKGGFPEALTLPHQPENVAPVRCQAHFSGSYEEEGVVLRGAREPHPLF